MAAERDAIQAEFEALARRFIGDSEQAARDVALYALQRADHLALVVGQVGYEQAVKAERDNVRMHAALTAARLSDVADARLREAIHTGLGMAARVLAVASA